MNTTVTIEGTTVHIVDAATGSPMMTVPVGEWRSLNRAVEQSMSDTFVSYDDAAARLGIHRSTLGDWIAQGKLERVIIDGRGFITATSISRIAEARGTRMGQRQRDARSTGPAGIVPSSADSSPDAHAIAGVLTNAANAVRPAEFPADPGEAQRPGMYSWWGDDEACALLGSQLGIELPHLLYVGQAGATKRRSGVRSKATLASRVPAATDCPGCSGSSCSTPSIPAHTLSRATSLLRKSAMERSRASCARCAAI